MKKKLKDEIIETFGIYPSSCSYAIPLNVPQIGDKIDKLDEVVITNETIVKYVFKRLDSLEKAKHFFDNLRKKFRVNTEEKKFNLKKKKEARMYSDTPKAFMPGSPSESPFSGNGPGGLLNHIKQIKDDKRDKKWDILLKK